MARSIQDNNDWKNSLPPGVDYYTRIIDENWDDFNFDVDHCDTTRVNGYLLHRIVLYQYEQLIDSKLWEYFKEDFEGWTIDTWNKGNREIIRHFRDFLCRNGVNVARNRALIANNIQSIIDNPDELIWTREEIQRQMNEPMTMIFSNISNFNSKHKPPGNGNNN